MTGFVFNWIDIAILIWAIYVIGQGWRQGIFFLLANLLSFAGSLWLSIKYHVIAGDFLTEKFGISSGWATVMGYLVIGFFAQIILDEMLDYLLEKLPEKAWGSKTNQILGAGVSLVNGLLIIAFVLLVVLELPLRGTIKKDIRASKIGNALVRLAETYGGQVKSVLDQVSQEARKFLTIAPASKDKISLDISPKSEQLTVDKEDEQSMLKMINKERVKAEVGQLTWDEKIAVVGRTHSKDMFERRYFSHYSPEGNDVGDRLRGAGITYVYAGENLAYAPDLLTAQEGLMNSEGHRKNILDPEFQRVGIGIIDSGIYGKMLTQIFVK